MTSSVSSLPALVGGPVGEATNQLIFIDDQRSHRVEAVTMHRRDAVELIHLASVRE